MATLKQFKLPDLGEGLTEGEILRWLVGPGDTVRLNQPIVEVETAKAAVEVPSPYAGVVTELHHAEGTTVDVGAPLITFDVGGDGAAAASAPAGGTVTDDRRPLAEDLVPATDRPAPDTGDPTGEPTDREPAAEERVEVLVGSGPKAGRRRRRVTSPQPAATAAGGATGGGAPAGGAAAELPPTAADRAGPAAAEVSVLAKPPVRKLARELGVDLRAVTGSGAHGVVTRDDVQRAAQAARSAGHPVAAVAGPGAGWPAGAPEIAFDPVTREARLPVRSVRRATAAAMVRSAFTAPHVTEFVTLDATASVQLVDRLRSAPGFAGLRVSPLLLAARALLVAVRRHPLANSSWDEEGQQIVVRQYVNLGIAAATPRGLVVPNIKDADRMSLVDLCRALNELADNARAGRSTPADMQHGTITITNVGVFGVDTGTPILTPGEAMILCLGRVRPAPWVHHGALAVRQVTTLGISFDHRIVDGQLGSQLLADVAAMLEDPTLLLAWT